MEMLTASATCLSFEEQCGESTSSLYMKIVYDPTVDALTIRFVEERVECEVIRLNDQVAIDIGPRERIVAIEVLDASELVPGIKDKGILLENLAVASRSLA
ncbi:MAG: DUF2283 domain-containing protein [bacterium]